MNQSIKAGSLYFVVVFAIGFFLGALRVLMLVPRFGEFNAVFLELPVMLAAAWFVCRWLVRKFHVPDTTLTRLVMGAIAFSWLMIAEIIFSVLIFKMPFELYVQQLLTAHGALGLAGQGVFATFPFLQLLIQKEKRL